MSIADEAQWAMRMRGTVRTPEMIRQYDGRDRYVTIRSEAEALERMAHLRFRVDAIKAGLEDPRSRPLWRSRAMMAKAIKSAQYRELKSWLAERREQGPMARLPRPLLAAIVDLIDRAEAGRGLDPRHLRMIRRQVAAHISTP